MRESWRDMISQLSMYILCHSLYCCPRVTTCVQKEIKCFEKLGHSLSTSVTLDQQHDKQESVIKSLFLFISQNKRLTDNTRRMSVSKTRRVWSKPIIKRRRKTIRIRQRLSLKGNENTVRLVFRLRRHLTHLSNNKVFFDCFVGETLTPGIIVQKDRLPEIRTDQWRRVSVNDYHHASVYFKTKRRTVRRLTVKLKSAQNDTQRIIIIFCQTVHI